MLTGKYSLDDPSSLPGGPRGLVFRCSNAVHSASCLALHPACGPAILPCTGVAMRASCCCWGWVVSCHASGVHAPVVLPHMLPIATSPMPVCTPLIWPCKPVLPGSVPVGHCPHALCLVPHTSHPSAHRRLPHCRQVLPGLAPLLDLMGQIAKRRGKTLSQVAINWAICQVGERCNYHCWDGLGFQRHGTCDGSTPAECLHWVRGAHDPHAGPLALEA